MIRDQIVFGIEDKKIRKRLPRETELKLEEAVKISHASELSNKHMQTFSEAATTNMNMWKQQTWAPFLSCMQGKSRQADRKQCIYNVNDAAHSISQENVLPLVNNAASAKARTTLPNSVFQKKKGATERKICKYHGRL